MQAPRRRSPLLALLTGAVLCACGAHRPQTEPVTAATPVAPTAARPVTDTAAAAGSGAAATTVMRGSTPALPTVAVARSDRSILSKDDIRATQYTNLYDVVATLRGNWIRVRSADSFGKSSTVQVYLDMQRLNGVDELRTMSPLNVLSVRFLDPIQASARWGLDHGAGAIFILTEKK